MPLIYASNKVCFTRSDVAEAFTKGFTVKDLGPVVDVFTLGRRTFFVSMRRRSVGCVPFAIVKPQIKSKQRNGSSRTSSKQ